MQASHCSKRTPNAAHVPTLHISCAPKTLIHRQCMVHPPTFFQLRQRQPTTRFHNNNEKTGKSTTYRPTQHDWSPKDHGHGLARSTHQPDATNVMNTKPMPPSHCMPSITPKLAPNIPTTPSSLKTLHQKAQVIATPPHPRLSPQPGHHGESPTSPTPPQRSLPPLLKHSTIQREVHPRPQRLLQFIFFRIMSIFSRSCDGLIFCGDYTPMIGIIACTS
jgi:hypothetical protein